MKNALTSVILAMPIDNLKRIVKLRENRDALLAKIEDINDQIDQIEAESATNLATSKAITSTIADDGQPKGQSRMILEFINSTKTATLSPTEMSEFIGIRPDRACILMRRLATQGLIKQQNRGMYTKASR